MQASEKLVSGCFAHMTAPFGRHPKDEQRAKAYRAALAHDGKTWQEAEAQIRVYLETTFGWPTSLEAEIEKARKFLKPTLDETQNNK